MNENLKRQLTDVDNVGNFLVGVFHRMALFVIGAATVWAAGYTFIEILAKNHASISDLLLLFIYLEIGAMVGIYFKTNHMPVRFLLYVAITAITRHVVDIMSHAGVDMMPLVWSSVATLIFSICVLLVRLASYKFPSTKDDVT